MVHQFCRVGRLAFLSGLSGTSKDMPPFVIQQNINWVAGLNLVGLRRAKMSAEQINALKRLYHIVYLQGLSVPNAVAQAEAELGHVDVVQEFLTFVRNAKRGINGAIKDSEALAA
jgi:UDP-N-acetylglucosamine acyltransferase